MIRKRLELFRVVWGFFGLLVIPLCAADNINSTVFTFIIIIWAIVFTFIPHKPRKDWK